MKSDIEKKLDRLIKIGIVFGVTILVLGIFIASFISLEIASFKEKVWKDVKSYIDTSVASDKITPIDADKLAKDVASIINLPKDGNNGQNGKDGSNGKDSVSTHTVVEKQTIVYESKPGQNGSNGRDGKQIEVGETPNGIRLWRYVGDNQWQKVPIIDLLTGVNDG